jgi:hypothetical protein
VKKHVLTAVFALVLGVLGFAVSGVALASNGNGNGGKPPGGQNPCPPSEHAVYDQNGNFAGCQQNGNPSGEPGGGIGNCGQNQSGDQGNGNGSNQGNGGDKGYGNGDGCTVTTTTPTDTTPTETTPTETTPTDTTPTETTPTETTPTESTPTETTPTGTTPTDTSTPSTTPTETTSTGSTPAATPSESSGESTTPSIVGQPPKSQHNPAHVKQSPAHSAVAGTNAKSGPKPTRQPQPAPFTL